LSIRRIVLTIFGCLGLIVLLILGMIALLIAFHLKIQIT